jgi:5-methylcytosine-specific restriction endonuclease McrA
MPQSRAPIILPTRICSEKNCERYAAARSKRCCLCGHRAQQRRRELLNDKANHRKRARRNGGKHEAVYAQRVFERDRWRCGVCRKKIDPKLKNPHPMSVSLDHVVPLSQGGDHSYANTQATHLTCNIARGARGGGEQLRLIGW